MICYRCGSTLTESEFCPECGENVALYKKVISLSNVYYNDGLQKATVRNLSGAINSLQHSIKLNKNGAIIESAPKPNKIPQISEVPVQGGTIKVDRTPNNLYSRAWHGEGPLGGLGSVASWFKKNN